LMRKKGNQECFASKTSITVMALSPSTTAKAVDIRLCL
jgi:hypothetical protein